MMLSNLPPVQPEAWPTLVYINEEICEYVQGEEVSVYSVPSRDKMEVDISESTNIDFNIGLYNTYSISREEEEENKEENKEEAKKFLKLSFLL